MKKYTLEFNNPSMEVDFQNARLINVQKPIYACLVLSAFGYQAIGSVQTYLLRDVEEAKLAIGMASFLFIQVCISFRYPQTILVNQILSVYLSIIPQFDISTATTQNDYYLYGSTIQLWQTCVIILCGFKHSLHLVFSTTMVRLTIQILVWVNTLRRHFLTMNFLNDKMARSQYLLNKKDLRWQQYMPSIIEKPYFIFEYNDIQRNFKCIEQQLANYIPFVSSIDQTLRSFLRNSEIENMTLELYLFKHYLNSHSEESSINVIYNKNHIKIKLYDLNIKNNQYLLILNIQQEISQKKHLIYQNYVQQYAQFIRRIIKLNKHKMSNKAVKIKGQIINNLFLSAIFSYNTELKTVNLAKLISKLCLMYSVGLKINIKFVSDSKIQVSTFRSQVFVFLNHLFLLFHEQYLKQISNITINLENDNPDVVYLKIFVPYEEIFLESYSQSPLLKRLEPNLLYSPISKNLELKFVRDIQCKFQIKS